METFRLCRELVDGVVLVDNSAISAAIKVRPCEGAMRPPPPPPPPCPPALRLGTQLVGFTAPLRLRSVSPFHSPLPPLRRALHTT